MSDSLSLDNEKQHRVFFALWPDASTRKQIVDMFEQSPVDKNQGRLVPANNIHITLHFIGNVNQQKLDCLHTAAQTVVAKRFKVDLNHYGYFKKPKVIWMGLKQQSEELTFLQKLLGEAITECEYQLEDRLYAPHLTLMRKLAQPEVLDDFSPIHWRVEHFVLVESISIEGGVHYEVVASYPLNSL